MTNHEPLTPMETDGFPELVYAMHDALDDLLGKDSDLDHEALAPELAHVAWKQLNGSPRLSDVWATGFEAGRIVAMSKAAREKRLAEQDRAVEPRCTCAATNAVGATSPDYRCEACTDGGVAW